MHRQSRWVPGTRTTPWPWRTEQVPPRAGFSPAQAQQKIEQHHGTTSTSSRVRGVSSLMLLAVSHLHPAEQPPPPPQVVAPVATRPTLARRKAAAGGKGDEDDNDNEMVQRRRRLELNRKAAHESRKRKKKKYQQLSDNLELLRAESLHLSERNDFMRQQLSTPQPTKYTQDKKVLEEENAMLRQALLTALEGLSEEDDEEHGAAEPKTVTGSGGAAP